MKRGTPTRQRKKGKKRGRRQRDPVSGIGWKERVCLYCGRRDLLVLWKERGSVYIVEGEICLYCGRRRSVSIVEGEIVSIVEGESVSIMEGEILLVIVEGEICLYCVEERSVCIVWKERSVCIVEGEICLYCEKGDLFVFGLASSCYKSMAFFLSPFQERYSLASWIQSDLMHRSFGADEFLY